MRTSPVISSRRERPGGLSVVAILVSTAVWVLLWDQVTVLVVLSGLLLSVLVGLVFPLPPISLHGRFRPVALLRLAGRLVTDLVRASASVLVAAFRFGSVPRSAIIAVKLRSRSDLFMTQVAELVSLVPGSIVLEARRSSSTLYLHIFNAVTPADLDQARQAVLDAEVRVVSAFGDAAEIAAITQGTPWPSLHDEHDAGVDRPEVTS